MNLIYYDDKKEKWQSHSVKADDTHYTTEGNFSWFLEAYGANKEEAVANLKRQATLLTKQINKAMEGIEEHFANYDS